MKKLVLPAYNECRLVGYAEMVPICKTFGNDSSIAEFSILIPGEIGSFKIYTFGSLAKEVARSIQPADFLMCYGRGVSTNDEHKFALHSVRIVDYGTDVDAAQMEPLQIINAYTIDIPEAGFHRVETD